MSQQAEPTATVTIQIDAALAAQIRTITDATHGDFDGFVESCLWRMAEEFMPGAVIAMRKRAERLRQMTAAAANLVRDIRVIAGALGLSVPEYVDSRLRPIVRQELPGVLEQMAAAAK